MKKLLPLLSVLFLFSLLLGDDFPYYFDIKDVDKNKIVISYHIVDSFNSQPLSFFKYEGITKILSIRTRYNIYFDEYKVSLRDTSIYMIDSSTGMISKHYSKNYNWWSEYKYKKDKIVINSYSGSELSMKYVTRLVGSDIVVDSFDKNGLIYKESFEFDDTGRLFKSVDMFFREKDRSKYFRELIYNIFKPNDIVGFLYGSNDSLVVNENYKIPPSEPTETKTIMEFRDNDRVVINWESDEESYKKSFSGYFLKEYTTIYNNKIKPSYSKRPYDKVKHEFIYIKK